ncbi:MAG TPA: ABC transporter ATP-binding protein [Candidatus Saccharimonadales bacterium]|nr:ABC transporter ATP-binding protein [Candidatus Saccharimonadales bacterium]
MTAVSGFPPRAASPSFPMGEFNAIICAALTKDYGPKRALDHLDLEVRAGEIFGYLGSNGAGKTTTIRCLLDLIRPSDGTATVIGLDSRADSVAVRRRTGYLAGDLRLWPHLTGRQTLGYLATLRGGVSAQRVAELAERMECDLTQRCGAMSHGQRQKVGVIQAFMHDPEVLILDEPTATLDPLMQHTVHDLVREARDRGATIFVSSHDLPEVAHLCDRAGILRLGKLVTVLDVGELARQGRHVLSIQFLEPVDPRIFESVPGVSEISRANHTVTLTVSGDLDPVVKAAARYRVRDLHTAEVDLDEVFRDYYRSEPADAR